MSSLELSHLHVNFQIFQRFQFYLLSLVLLKLPVNHLNRSKSIRTLFFNEMAISSIQLHRPRLEHAHSNPTEAQSERIEGRDTKEH